LYNPGVFWTKTNDIDSQFPRVDKILREYFEIVKSVDPHPASRHSMKSHFFKLMHEFLNHRTELRPMIGKTSVHSSFDEWEKIVEEVERIVKEEIVSQPNFKGLDVVVDGKVQEWGGHYKTVPYWRCQPFFRKVDGERQNTRLLKVAGENDLMVTSNEAKEKLLKRGLEGEIDGEGNARKKLAT